MVKMAIGVGTDTSPNPGLRKRTAPVSGIAPAMLAAPDLSGPGLVGASMRVDPGVWSGVPTPVLSLRWRRNGVDVRGATASEYVPVAADDGAELRCAVTATNPAGSAEAVTEALRVTREPPVAAGGLPDAVFDQGGGVMTVATASDFTGEGLTFGVTGPGASIDPATGAVGIDTAAPVSGGTVTVTATNSGGSASSAFRVTVEAVDSGLAIGRMDPPRLVEGSQRSTRLALTLAAAPDAGGDVITGYDLRFAWSPTSVLESAEGEDEPAYEILSGAGPEIRLTGLAPGGFAHVQSRAVTGAGRGPWSTTRTIALAGAFALTFRDTFTTGVNGAKVNASGRLPDIGTAWVSYPGTASSLTLIQPEGRATHGSAGIFLDPRVMRGAVFDGGFWSGGSGTLEADFNIGASGAERCNMLACVSPDGSDYIRLLFRNEPTNAARFQILWRTGGVPNAVDLGEDEPIPTLIRGQVNTLRLSRDGDTLRFALNGTDEIEFSDLAGLPSGSLWGVGGDSLGRPAWLDDVRFSDVPSPPLAPLRQSFGPIQFQVARTGTTLTSGV